MPLLSEQQLIERHRPGLTHDAAYAQKTVGRAQTRIHGQLARTQSQNAVNVQRLQEIVAAAEQKGAALQKQLPQLSQLADVAVGEERDTSHRNYLQAVQNIQRCTQIRDAASRELIIARNH